MLDKEIVNRINFDLAEKIIYFYNFDFDNYFDSCFDNYYMLILTENHIIKIN